MTRPPQQWLDRLPRGLGDRLDLDADGRLSALRLHLPLLALQAWVAADAFLALQLRGSVARTEPVQYLWPVTWMRWFEWDHAVTALALMHVTAAFVALVLYRHRWARAIGAVTLLQWTAAINAFGKIGHGNHHLVLATLVLATIPTLAPLGATADDQHRTRLQRLLVAQAMILLTYTMSGMWKVLDATRAVFENRPGMFTDISLPGHVGRQFEVTGTVALLGDWVLANPLVSSLAFVAASLLELIAITTLLRPRLARVTAIGLVLIHAGIYLTTAINFKSSMATLIALFIFSPFLVERVADDGRQVAVGTDEP